jgi:hypothetical protein
MGHGEERVLEPAMTELTRKQVEHLVCDGGDDSAELYLAHDAALRAKLEGVEQKLKNYTEWYNDADECYVSSHAQFQQQLATAQARVRELEQQLTTRDAEWVRECQTKVDTLAAERRRVWEEAANLADDIASPEIVPDNDYDRGWENGCLSIKKHCLKKAQHEEVGDE